MTGTGGVRSATGAELAAWDERTVGVPDGHVQQSRAWGEHRGGTGWRPHFLVTEDGAFALALGRPWPLVGGGRLYLPRGPVGGGASETGRAERLADIAGWARAQGYDEIVTDAEVPADTGYPALLRERGFHQVEEIDASRHRMSVPIPGGVSEAEIRAGIAGRARQRFHMAERRGYRVVRHDALSGSDPGEGFEAPAPAAGGATMGGTAGAATEAAFERFHGLLVATGARRGFAIGPRASATAWWRAALAAGHMLLLEVRAPDDTYLGGAVFYRHGTRLTYGHSADVAALRPAYPGAVQLILWRALQLAIREGRDELDLGGVDVAGAREEPRRGDPMYGLYEFKRAYGARWVEQAGAHARVFRPGRMRVGAAIARAGRGARRVLARTGRGG